MELDVHAATVPVFTRTLTNMGRWLDKAEAHAAARKFDVNVLLACRLAPDMFTLVRQFQSACDHAKNGVARLAGSEIVRIEDNEQTVADVRARIARTLELVAAADPAAMRGALDRTISWGGPRGTRSMQGRTYVLHYLLPNFFFHATTAYGILRHNGVDVGKADFIGDI